ncbi:hypothetical protein ACQKOD_24780 [Bacillus mycoides]|uniref:hypothetical protein n=1 Tax=Bacillus mycoides TaxID=1405 RepID=UPI003D034B9F
MKNWGNIIRNGEIDMAINFKKIVLGTFVAGSVFTGALVSDAFAANTGDTGFYFKFSGYNGSTVSTEVRNKQNSTSSYMKLGSINDGVYGYSAEVVDSSGNHFSKRYSQFFGEYEVGKGVYIANYAAEDRGLPVGVRIKAVGREKPADYRSWAAEGKWSPDSI